MSPVHSVLRLTNARWRQHNKLFRFAAPASIPGILLLHTAIYAKYMCIYIRANATAVVTNVMQLHRLRSSSVILWYDILVLVLPFEMTVDRPVTTWLSVGIGITHLYYLEGVYTYILILDGKATAMHSNLQYFDVCSGLRFSADGKPKNKKLLGIHSSNVSRP